MVYYDMVNILTNVIFIIAIYLLLQTFLGNEVYNKNLRNIEYIVFYIASSSIIFITRIPLIMFIFNLSMIFIISLNYKVAFQRKIIGTTFTYAICLVVEIVVSVSFDYTNIDGLSNSEFNSVAGLITIRLVTLVFAYLINRFASVFGKSLKIPKTYYFVFTFISIGTIYLFLNSLNNSDISISSVLLSSIVLCGINILMIFMDKKIYKSIVMSERQEKLHQQNVAYENQNNIIKQSNARIKMLEHDMKNHLEILNKMYEENKKDEIEEYTKSILEKMEHRAISNSNNFVIDSIINFKLATLEEDIELNINICIPYTLNIMAIDLTTIMGNILDNAITGVASAKEKFIDLEISYKKENLVIILKNSFDGNLIEDKGKLKTTKLYNTKHGLGISSVEEALEKYNGTIDIEHTSKMFLVGIIIPLSQV